MQVTKSVSLMLHDMKLKCHVDWDAARKQYVGFVDCGNDAESDDSNPAATDT